MSVASGEYFTPPSHPADFDRPGEQIWMPSDARPAELRWKHTATQQHESSVCVPTGLLSVEQVAAAGMRAVFERFDIRSFYIAQTDPSDTHAEIHEAALAFPSSKRLAQLADDFATTSKRVERFRIKHCDGRYDGPDFLSALASHQLLMSTGNEIESPNSDGGTYHLGYFAHDTTVHFPAWLCLPQDISQRIRRKATDTMNDYNAAKNAPGSERLALAQERVNSLGFLLDQTVNIWRMRDIVQGDTEIYDANMSQILGIESQRYSKLTREHIAHPNKDVVLAARPKGW